MKEKTKRYLIVGSIVFAEIAFVLYFIVGPQAKIQGAKIPDTVKKAMEVFNKNFSPYIGAPATIEGQVTQEYGLYKFHLKIGERLIPAYLTKDGRLLFFSPLDLTQLPSLPQQAQQTTPQKNPKEVINLEGEPVLGNPQAPLTMVEFSDFECPFSKKFALEIFPQIKKNYVDTGKVKVVFKNFPLGFHPNAFNAALASECAHEQGKFWEYAQILLENQQSLDVDNLKKYAKQIGLNEKKFNECLDSKKYEDKVKKDLQEGTQAGVKGTPAVFIDWELIEGALPFEAFAQKIDEKLGK